MKQYQLWDKLSPINGVGAATLLENNTAWREATDIYLISSSENPTQITHIEQASIIRTINADWSELPDDEVMEAYCLMLDGQQIISVKESKMAEIRAYDASTSVNEFTVNGYGLWLTPAERGNFKNYLDAKITLGAQPTDSISYVLGGISVTLTIADGLGMLAQIEVYAGESAIVTAQHIAAVNALTTDAEIEAYDYTVGYPAKLSYSLIN